MMNLKIALIAGCLIFLGGAIFFLNRNSSKKSNNETVFENKNMITHLSTEEYKELIQNKKVWNLDVRESYEFEEGHIEGATLVPSTRFDEFFDELKIKKAEKIALYCRSGSRSAFIAEKLAGKGYGNVYNLELGLIDWRRKGFQIAK